MVINAFNGVYFAVLGVFAALTIGLSLILKNRSENVRKWTIIGICIANIIFFWVYKYWLSIDIEYLHMTGYDKINWFNELPLQLCNINMFLIPTALLTKKRGLLGFCFVVAPVAALLAMTFPSVGFAGYSIFLPRNLGFFITHGLIITCAICLATLGFYRPKVRDLPGIALTLFILSSALFGVNHLLRATGLCAEANYFYTVEPEGISILEVFWSIIPVQFVYLAVFGLIILVVYFLILCLFFGLGKKKADKTEDTEIGESAAIEEQTADEQDAEAENTDNEADDEEAAESDKAEADETPAQ